jgi:hypothetical protein
VREPYPLQWPDGWKRTKAILRERSRFGKAGSVGAMRGLDRWGAGDVVSRAFAGFNALPPGSGDESIPAAPKKRPWRDVIGGAWPPLDQAELLVLARSRHRTAIKTAHPDAGGSHELAAELNAALAEAERELGATS